MNIFVDEQVFSLAPEFTRYTLYAKNISNQAENSPLLALLRKEEEAVRQDPAFGDLKNHPRLAVWRDLFSSFGINPNRCPPSVFNLVKRVRGGKDLPFVNSLVCIFNILSLRHTIPAGGDDLDAVSGDIGLLPALGNERYIPLGSNQEAAVEHPQPGEIILTDTGNGTVLCRAWCWKNGDTTKIQSSSNRVAINLDVLPPVGEEEGKIIAETAKSLIEEHCGAKVTVFRLDASNRSFTIPAE